MRNALVLISFNGLRGITTLNSSKFLYVQSVITASNYIMIINCEFILKNVNTTGMIYSKPPNGIIKTTTLNTY